MLAEFLTSVGGLFAGAAVLVFTFLVVRGGSWLIQRVRYHRTFLVLFHPAPPGPDQTGPHLAPDLIARVSGYLGADPRGSLAPGAMASTAPSTAAEPLPDALASPSGLARAFVTLWRAHRPSFHVHLTPATGAGTPAEPEAASAESIQVTVTIVKQPGGKLIASRLVEVVGPDSTAAAAETIGAFCLQQVHRQRSVARLTPRWERWHSALGYRSYRTGLHLRDRALEQQAQAYHRLAQQRQAQLEAEQIRAERAALTGEPGSDARVAVLTARLDQLAQLAEEPDQAPSWDEWRATLLRASECFRLAALADPGNVLPWQARAAALELLGDFATAEQLYLSCHKLWPEQIEQMYRLSVYQPRSSGRPDAFVRAAERRLRLSRLFRRWLATWLPGRWAPGERRYWSSWLRPSHPQAPWSARPTRRREFLAGLRVARIGRQVARLALGAPPPPSDRGEAVALLAELARQVGLRSSPLAWASDSGPPVGEDPADRPEHRAGWLAHYNAACAFSLALCLPAERLPAGAGARWQGWQERCAAAALGELNQVLRDPYHQLDPSWLYTDLDLAPLCQFLRQLPQQHPLAGYAGSGVLAARPAGEPSPYLPPAADGAVSR